MAAQGLLSHFGGAFNDIVLDEVSEDCELIPENGSLGSTSADTYTKCNDAFLAIHNLITPVLVPLVLQPHPPAVNKHKYDHQMKPQKMSGLRGHH